MSEDRIYRIQAKGVTLYPNERSAWQGDIKTPCFEAVTTRADASSTGSVVKAEIKRPLSIMLEIIMSLSTIGGHKGCF